MIVNKTKQKCVLWNQHKATLKVPTLMEGVE